MPKLNLRAQKAIANCRTFKRQYQVKNPDVRTYQKATPEIIVELLEGVRGPSSREARNLLCQMADSSWAITSTAHEGGSGGSGRGADPVLHFTARIGGSSYHLRCKVNKSGRLYIFEITV